MGDGPLSGARSVEGLRHRVGSLARVGALLVLAVTLLAPPAVAEPTVTGLAPNAEPLDDALGRVLDSGELVMAVRADAAPFSAELETTPGAFDGYSVDLCRRVVDAIARDAGRDVAIRYLPVSAQDRFEVLRQGQATLLCEATTVTLDRPITEKVDFSLLTFIAGGSYLFNRNGPPNFDDLDAGKIGAVAGTTASEGLRDAEERKYIEGNARRDFADYPEALIALEAGEIDVLLGDRLILQRILEDPKNGLEGTFDIADRYLSYEPYALALPLNEPRLQRAVNGVLAELYRSGDISQLVNQHFTLRELPPRLNAMFKIMALP
ncbi:transporter substrate-binding domain-containing protein [Tropicimonas sp. S265A]|uniref:transporter substrate-binding domain-containing protein n=1 Tax=Tropicimonas sp. S265A TaxID=3415134 RepID=UPI003C7C9DC4